MNSMRFLKTSRGFSLPELLMGLAALGGVAILILSLAQTQRKSHQINQTNSMLGSLRQNLVTQIANQDAWDNTKTKNQNAMGCLRNFPSTCTPSTPSSTIDLYSSDGTLLVSSNSANAGFNQSGLPCNSFGSAECPYKAVVKWKVQCSDQNDCKYPEEIVSVSFQYSPTGATTNNAINISKYDILPTSRTNMAENNSPVIACLVKSNSVFIGIGKSVKNGDGLTISADGDGCVSIATFKGAKGDQGDKGDKGPMGAPGVNGKNY